MHPLLAEVSQEVLSLVPWRHSWLAGAEQQLGKSVLITVTEAWLLLGLMLGACVPSR